MSGLGILLVVLMAGLIPVWLFAEFKASRLVRVGVGVLTFAACVLLTYGFASVLTKLNYNAWFGGATKTLIETSIAGIEDGHLERVLDAWRALGAEYQPTYENRAGYQKLVETTIRAMKSEPTLSTTSNQPPLTLNAATWIGHWEDDTGFWIVINNVGQPFDVIRSGEPSIRMNDVSISRDHKTLKFIEGKDWLHTLTLKNKYEARHEWFDVKQQRIWQIQTVHKLRRASDSERALTQQ